ncbi:MAG TPA: hypothetical protein VN278_04115 [Methanosarcina sp.]|nr:hypothetical protein [Methanosarcina sp.]
MDLSELENYFSEHLRPGFQYLKDLNSEPESWQDRQDRGFENAL